MSPVQLEHRAAQQPSAEREAFSYAPFGLVVSIDSQKINAEARMRLFPTYVINEYDSVEEKLAKEVYINAISINANKDFWKLFGYEVVEEDDSLGVTSPSTIRMNNIKQALLADTGVNSGTFIDCDADFIPETQFAEYIAEGFIPMATRDDYLLHDNLLHRRGYSVMCAEIFERFKESAKLALDNNDQALICELIDTLDDMSSKMTWEATTSLDASDIAKLYARFMHPLAAGVLAAQDSIAQQYTGEKLREKAARSQVSN